MKIKEASRLLHLSTVAAGSGWEKPDKAVNNCLIGFRLSASFVSKRWLEVSRHLRGEFKKKRLFERLTDFCNFITGVN